MQTVLITLTLIISTALCGFAQSPYEAGMQKGLAAWQEGKPDQAVQIFERIAKVETENWIPVYYAAMISTLSSFNIKDETVLKAKLTKAQEYLDQAKSLSPDNPELLITQAQWYTAWIVFNGEKYGMQYAPKVSQLYQQAAAIAPDNPRVAFGAVEWELGSARYFGADVAPYCEKLQKAILLYDSYTSSEAFYPMHGKEYAERVIEATCN